MAKNTLTASFIVGLMCMATACDPQQKDTSPQDQALNGQEGIVADFRGGMSSGGGGTLTGLPAGGEQVSEVIGSAKRDLQMMFNALSLLPLGEDLSIDGDTEAFYDFFIKDESSATINQLIRTIAIKDQQAGSCQYGGTETDGSYHQADGICISSQRLAGKLDQSSVYSQTMALIVHEVAHAFGANEAQAQKVQLTALKLLAEAQRPEEYYHAQVEIFETVQWRLEGGVDCHLDFNAAKCQTLVETFSSLNSAGRDSMFAIFDIQSLKSYMALFAYTGSIAHQSVYAYGTEGEFGIELWNGIQEKFQGRSAIECYEWLELTDGDDEPLDLEKVKAYFPEGCQLHAQVDQDRVWSTIAVERDNVEIIKHFNILQQRFAELSAK